MSTQMLAVRKDKPAKGALLTELPIPTIKANEVLVKVKATSICGTDKHIYEWDEWSQNRIKKIPFTFGHECAGEVVEIGKDVKRVKVGDHVSAETHIPCGYCPQCLTGLQHICHNLVILGVDTNGCFAEYVVIPEVCCWKNDKSLPMEIACIQEPFGNAMYTVNESQVSGKQILVIGDGPIAAFAVGIAKAFGAAPIIAVGKYDERINILKKMGAHKTLSIKKDNIVDSVLQMTQGYGVDSVLEMTGQQDAIDWGLRLVKKGGIFTAFGIPSKKVTIDLSGGVVFKGSKIIGINGRVMFNTWFQTATVLSNGLVDPRPVITHKFALKDFEKGMAVTSSANRDCGKVVFTL